MWYIKIHMANLNEDILWAVRYMSLKHKELGRRERFEVIGKNIVKIALNSLIPF